MRTATAKAKSPPQELARPPATCPQSPRLLDLAIPGNYMQDKHRRWVHTAIVYKRPFGSRQNGLIAVKASWHSISQTRELNDMQNFQGRDILSLKDMQREELLYIFSIADKLKHWAQERRNTDLLKSKTLLTAFYQPSTRTRLATEAAMHRLGGHVLGFSDPAMTRAGDFYQESIKDTVHMLEFYCDVIAMRHHEQGAPHEAAKWASVPVINCGDGWGEHPTQVLTDLYTIWQEHGRLDGLSLLCVGDMRMRTMHSLLYAISQFDIRAFVVSPSEMSLSQEFKTELNERNVQYREFETVESCIAEADIIYMEPVIQADYTQSRVEAPTDLGVTPAAYRVTRQMLRNRARPGSIILHSLPRMDELPPDIDSTRHARYWTEAFNGVVIRMALLALILGAIG